MFINADDFGYSESVNNAIAECFYRGVINRTTIMVNMPEAENAARLAQTRGFFGKVGLHINLTEGKALSEECAKSPLCDENGFFKGTFHIPFSARLYLNSEIKKAIYAEVEAQIKKYLDMGFTLFHADSHNYTHVYLSVYSQVKILLKKYGFKSIRISRNIPENEFSLPFKIYKGIFNFLIKRLKINGEKIYTTQYFGSIQDFEASKNKFIIRQNIELMTHPDLKNGELIDNTLPVPHPFITKEWIEQNQFIMKE